MQQLLHGILSKSLPHIHIKRINALLNAVTSLLHGKKLSLTQLGRNMRGRAKERHCIRKMDRLLGNEKLHAEMDDYYKTLSTYYLKNLRHPILNVDWACVNKKKGLYILRASLALKGRGVVIYQRTYPVSLENSPKAHLDFLKGLKGILPSGCRPILVTDAGFRCPWFKSVTQMDFDYVGRVRNKTGYQQVGSDQWEPDCLEFYKKATSLPCFIGRLFLAKSVKIECSLVLYKKVAKQRKHLNRLGNPTNNTQSNRAARNKKDPWLLATSLDINDYDAKKIVTIYQKRMQIEEEFRDLKSHQHGFGLRYSLSNRSERINVLLLIAALACFLCWIIAIAAKNEKKQYDFQANSIKSHDVLSNIYLACQIIRRRLFFSKRALNDALIKFQQLCEKLNHA